MKAQVRSIILSLTAIVFSLSASVGLAALDWHETVDIDNDDVLVAQERGVGEWEIAKVDDRNVLIQKERGKDGVIAFPFELPETFVLTADIKFVGDDLPRHWAGVIFHFADRDNYYTARMKPVDGGGVQLLQRVPEGTQREGVDGAWMVQGSHSGMTIPLDEWFTLEVWKDADKVTIYVGDRSFVFNFHEDTKLQSGYVGFYSRSDSDGVTYLANLTLKSLYTKHEFD